MALPPVISEGVSCLSFCLEDEEQLVPYGYIGEQLGHKKEARSKLMSKKMMLEGFLGVISREDYKKPKIFPCRDFFGIEYMKQGRQNWLERKDFLCRQKKIKKEIV
jgi:hypothetical protein